MSAIKTREKYDEAVVKRFKEFVGTKEFKKLNKRFNTEKFAGKWNQVLCSLSTGLFGSGGPNFSSVQATYTLKKKGLLGVNNEAYNTELNKVSATGTSRARDEDVPMCRTVKFTNLFDIEGDYWLIYATPSFNTVIVSAPLIVNVFNIPLVVANNFGVYVLTRNKKKFWNDSEEYQPTLDALKKYGFINFINRAIVTGSSFEL
jgi:lipocalin